MARASRVRIVLDADAIPIHRGTRHLAQRVGLDPLALALGGGEDYELLAALPAEAVPRAEKALRTSRMSLTAIGRIERGRPAVVLHTAGGTRPLPPFGFDHFQEARNA